MKLIRNLCSQGSRCQCICYLCIKEKDNILPRLGQLEVYNIYIHIYIEKQKDFILLLLGQLEFDMTHRKEKYYILPGLGQLVFDTNNNPHSGKCER